MDKYTFPPSGATGYLVTPSHKLGRTFKFKDYAPKVFKKIREHFGVDKVRTTVLPRYHSVWIECSYINGP